MTKTATLQIRCSPEQKAAIQARAKKNGKKVSQFLLDLALQGVDVAPDEPRLIEDPAQEAAEMVGQQERFADGEAERLERGNAGKGAPIDKDFTDEMQAIAAEDRSLPTPEEVDQLALTIHNTEGLPMRVALSTALHRLSR